MHSTHEVWIPLVLHLDSFYAHGFNDTHKVLCLETWFYLQMCYFNKWLEKLEYYLIFASTFNIFNQNKKTCFSFMCMSFLCKYSHTCLLWMPRSPEQRFIEGSRSPCGRWEHNPGPLYEQHVPLTTEGSLSPLMPFNNLFLFYLHTIVLPLCMYVCRIWMKILVPRQLSATMWVLGIDPGCSGTVASAFNCWVISPPLYAFINWFIY